MNCENSLPTKIDRAGPSHRYKRHFREYLIKQERKVKKKLVRGHRLPWIGYNGNTRFSV